MQISSIQSNATDASLLIKVLQAAQQQQVELVEKLISTETAAKLDAWKYEIAGQIIDVYA